MCENLALETMMSRIIIKCHITFCISRSIIVKEKFFIDNSKFVFDVFKNIIGAFQKYNL